MKNVVGSLRGLKGAAGPSNPAHENCHNGLKMQKDKFLKVLSPNLMTKMKWGVCGVEYGGSGSHTPAHEKCKNWLKIPRGRFLLVLSQNLLKKMNLGYGQGVSGMQAPATPL